MQVERETVHARRIMEVETRTEDTVETIRSGAESPPKYDENDIEIDDILSRPRHVGLTRQRRQTFEEAPEFVKRLNAFEEAKHGDTVVFRCSFKAFPNPSIKWYRDDEEITENGRYGFEAREKGEVVLTIEDVSRNDEGAYKCKAENQEGVASTTGYLSVTGDDSDKILSSQNRGDRNEHAISSPPPLRTIVEQKSLEEREEDITSRLPPSPIHDFVDNFRRDNSWPLMHGVKRSLGKAVNGGLEDEGEDSGSDTSCDSQDYDRVFIDVPQSDNYYEQEPLNEDEPRSEPDMAESELPVTSPLEATNQSNGQTVADTLTDNENLYSNRIGTQDVEVIPSTYTGISRTGTRYEIPWLYYFGLVCISTFVASAFNISPEYFVLFVMVVSLISFRFLIKTVKKESLD